MGQYQTFIIRIWTDGTASSPRGHIQHIGSRRGRYFRDEEKMMRFIREFLEPAILPAVEELDTPPAEVPTEQASDSEDPRRGSNAADDA